MTRSAALPLASLLVFAATGLPARAQDVQIDANGIRAGNTTIDAGGVRTPGASVTARGVSVSAKGATTAGAGGRDVSVVDNNQRGAFDCGGGAASVAGNGNTLTLNNCSSVSVMGNHNRVTALIVGAADVSVPGNDNTVVYRRARGVKAASVSNMGNGNKVSGN